MLVAIFVKVILLSGHGVILSQTHLECCLQIHAKCLYVYWWQRPFSFHPQLYSTISRKFERYWIFVQ